MSENNNQKSRVAQLALRSAMSSIGVVEQPEFVEFALGAGAVSANHAWVVVLEQCERSCLLYTSPSPRDRQKSRMPSSA